MISLVFGSLGIKGPRSNFFPYSSQIRLTKAFVLEAAAFNFAFGRDPHFEAIEGEVFACDDVAC